MLVANPCLPAAKWIQIIKIFTWSKSSLINTLEGHRAVGQRTGWAPDGAEARVYCWNLETDPANAQINK